VHGCAVQPRDGYIVGNVIYGIHHPTDPGNVYNAGAISVRGLVNVYIVGNTLYDFDGGINGPPAGINFQVFNNVIAGRTAAAGSEIDIANPSPLSSLDHNLFYRVSGIRIQWDGGTYTTASFAGTCGACTAGDPQFTDPVSRVFSIPQSSPAVNAGVPHPAYGAFLSRYGLTIGYDLTRGPRPMGPWDIGAYEYGALVGAPSAPRNLRIGS
jgi:hypothetical protein